MKQRILLLLAVASILVGSAFAKPGLPLVMYPSKAEQAQMLNEADDFIDDMADGLQDRQADAIYHAMRGVGGELAQVRSSRNKDSNVLKGVERTDIKGEGTIKKIKMRLYRPEKRGSAPLPLLVYFHGGGWTFGSIESCSAFCDELAATGNVMVLAVDYCLAPESPFSDALMDCEESIQYAIAHAKEWGSSPAMVSVGGDSAGGNLALASTMALNKNKKLSSPIKSVVLIYPVLKAYNDKSASWKKYSRGYGLDGRLMEAFNAAYLSDGKTNPQNPLVSPANASDNELKNLPPMLMISAGRDILFDQGKEFADRLKKLGKTIDRIEFSGAVHTFVTVKGQPTAFKKAAFLTAAFLK